MSVFRKKSIKTQRQSTPGEREANRLNPEFFDPFYDYCGIIGLATKPALPLKPKTDQNNKIMHDNELPENLQNISKRKAARMETNYDVMGVI